VPSTLILSEIALLALLILLSGFFSGSEIALFSTNRVKIRKLAEEGDRNARVLEELLSRPNRLLTAILVGNNLVNIGAAAIATSLAIQFFGSKGVGLATGVMTLLVLIFGEITPKGVATRNSERISLLVARPIATLVKLLYPIVKVLVFITKPIVTAFGGKSNIPFVTEEEIKMLVEVGEKEGVIEKEEKEMIKGIFEFGETTAKEVMVPRIDMKCISADATIEDGIKLALETGHSRFPVFEESVDNIIGILYTKDILRYLDKRKLKLRQIIRPAYYVPETKKLDELLEEMQEKKTQIAIVVDEYGGTAGLVTLEDIIEEIVGEIWEEHEVIERPIQKIDDTSAIVLAKASIEDVNEELGINLPEEEFETIGGLIFNALGKIPTIGEAVEINGVSLIVEKMRGRRISLVKVVKEPN
jgi:gliding motility-associated protein GldE